MKILGFTDTHGYGAVIEKLLKKAAKVDLLICAGDLTVFGQGLEAIFSRFDALGKPMLFIPGNHEGPHEPKRIVKKFKNITVLHGDWIEIGGFVFFGHGDDGFASRDPSFEKSSSLFLTHKHEPFKTVLITHAPAFNTKLDIVSHRHVGNKSILEFITAFQPKVHICGHIHECEGLTDKIGKTTTINPAHDGRIIEI